jgi:hypothetical protein
LAHLRLELLKRLPAAGTAWIRVVFLHVLIPIVWKVALRSRLLAGASKSKRCILSRSAAIEEKFAEGRLQMTALRE